MFFGIGVARIGLSIPDFLSLTLDEFSVLYSEHLKFRKEQNEIQSYNIRRLCFYTIVSSGAKGIKKPEDLWRLDMDENILSDRVRALKEQSEFIRKRKEENQKRKNGLNP